MQYLPHTNELGRTSMHRLCFAAAMLAASALASTQAGAADKQIERGKYLGSLAACTDCHTPGSFLGKPDMTQFLGGSDVGFAIPNLGVFVGRNLTPDKETASARGRESKLSPPS